MSIVTERTHPDDAGRTTARTPRLRIAAAWAVVAVPLAYGIAQTVLKSAQLFS